MTTEPELFAGYRRGRHYAAPCACGVMIHVPTVRNEQKLMDAIDAHDKTTVHLAWRSWRQALDEVRARDR